MFNLNLKGTIMKIKNCNNCGFLENADGGGEYSSGVALCCNKRKYRNDYEEDKHLAQLESDKYLETPKKCCILETKEVVRCKN